MGGTEYAKIKEAAQHILKNTFIDLKNEKNLHQCTEKVLREVQRNSKTWQQLTEEHWTLECKRYKDVYQIVRQEGISKEKP